MLGQTGMLHELSDSFANTQPYHGASLSKILVRPKRHNQNTVSKIKRLDDLWQRDADFTIPAC